MIQFIPPGVPTSTLLRSIAQYSRSIRFYFSRPEIKLGRWSLVYDPIKIEDRVRRSNEDHSF
jgi:hypothetical protein